MAEERWWRIEVELLSGLDWEAPSPPPGRIMVARETVLLAELGHAIDLAFGRWDHSHLHEFRLGDDRSFILGGHEDLTPPAAPSETITLADAGLARVDAEFFYIFDLGDDWTHACTILEPTETPDFIGAPAWMVPRLPFADWGWGQLPDQYLRTEADG